MRQVVVFTNFRIVTYRGIWSESRNQIFGATEIVLKNLQTLWHSRSVVLSLIYTLWLEQVPENQNRGQNTIRGVQSRRKNSKSWLERGWCLFTYARVSLVIPRCPSMRFSDSSTSILFVYMYCLASLCFLGESLFWGCRASSEWEVASLPDSV